MWMIISCKDVQLNGFHEEIYSIGGEITRLHGYQVY